MNKKTIARKTPTTPRSIRKQKEKIYGDPKPVRLEKEVEKLLAECVSTGQRHEADVLRTAISEFVGNHKTRESIQAAVESHKRLYVYAADKAKAS